MMIGAHANEININLKIDIVLGLGDDDGRGKATQAFLKTAQGRAALAMVVMR